MSEVTTFLLDASPLIQAKRTYYGFDFCPAFWDVLDRGHAEGRVFSIDRVRDELKGEGEADDLAKWAFDDDRADFFLDSRTAEVATTFGPMMQWVQAQDQFKESAKAEFARTTNADGWLVAAAKHHGMTVVTHEVANPEVKKRVPIPNLCDAFGVLHADVYDLIRELNGVFTLKP